MAHRNRFTFSNLLGSVYRAGDVRFLNDGTSLLSPVGNRLCVFDLKRNRTRTVELEARHNIRALAVSPNGCFAFATTDNKNLILVSLVSRSVVRKQFFGVDADSAVAFAPNGEVVAVSKGVEIFLFDTPTSQFANNHTNNGNDDEIGGMKHQHRREFNPFAIRRRLFGCTAAIRAVEFSADSEALLASCADGTAHLFIHPLHRHGRAHITLSADPVGLVSGFLVDESDASECLVVGAHGTVVHYRLNADDRDNLHVFEKPVKSKRSKEQRRENDDNLVASKDTLNRLNLAQFNQSKRHAPSTDQHDSSDASSAEQSDTDDEDERESTTFKASDGKREKIDSNESSVTKTKRKAKSLLLRYRRVGRHSINRLRVASLADGVTVTVTSAAFHRATSLLAVGQSDGAFLLVEFNRHADIVPVASADGDAPMTQASQLTVLQSLAVSELPVDMVRFNNVGDWLALGVSRQGQLGVWEWKSRSFILQQQSHHDFISSVDYSPDGRYVITGSTDGKLKLWSEASGFCIVTFSDHTAGVTGCQFAQSGRAVVSASLDGTVRAFDLVRYRNFRTYLPPRDDGEDDGGSSAAVQFGRVAVDSSSSFVAACLTPTSSLGTAFDVFVWSFNTGVILEVLTGHESPVSSLDFGPYHAVLATGSWDKTVRLYWISEGANKRNATTGDNVDSLQLTHEVACCRFRPDGLEVAAATLDAQICFFDVESAKQTRFIEARLDIGYARRRNDAVTARQLKQQVYFSTMSYTPDGKSILAGGTTKYICFYDIASTQLIKRFEISVNLSLEGVEMYLKRGRIAEFGAAFDRSAVADYEKGKQFYPAKRHTKASADDHDQNEHIPLPGARVKDASARDVINEARCQCIRASPTGMAFAAAGPEGVAVYALAGDDSCLIGVSDTFDPLDLEPDVTPAAAEAALVNGELQKALLIGLKLDDRSISHRCFEAVGVDEIDQLVGNFPSSYLDRLALLLAQELESTAAVERCLMWMVTLLRAHGQSHFRATAGGSGNRPALTMLQKVVVKKSESVGKLCDYVLYGLDYVIECCSRLQLNDETSNRPESLSVDL